jgi:hypothetical protein
MKTESLVQTRVHDCELFNAGAPHTLYSPIDEMGALLSTYRSMTIMMDDGEKFV